MVLHRFSTGRCGKRPLRRSRQSRHGDTSADICPDGGGARQRRGAAVERRRRLPRVDLERLRRAGRPLRGRAPRRSASAAATASCSCCATGPSSTWPIPRPLLLGATPVSIYNSSAPEQIEYLVGHSEASVAVVEDIGFLERFLKVRSELPDAAPRRHRRRPRRLGPERRRAVGRHARRGATRHRRRARQRAARRPADNHLHLGNDWPAEGRDARPREPRVDARLVPSRRSAPTRPVGALCHICRWRTSPSARCRTTPASTTAYEVTSCPDPALVVPYLVQTRPQFFFAVPRVWEKAYAALRAGIAADPAKAEQFEGALAAGWQVAEAHRARRGAPGATRRRCGNRSGRSCKACAGRSVSTSARSR